MTTIVGISRRLNRAIGELLDRWELMNNDLRGEIQEQEPAFYDAIQTMYRIRSTE
jgi:hypothetical protein